jgi:hypothetical protein
MLLPFIVKHVQCFLLSLVALNNNKALAPLFLQLGVIPILQLRFNHPNPQVHVVRQGQMLTFFVFWVSTATVPHPYFLNCLCLR